MASNFDTREEMLHRRAQMAETDADRWQQRYRDLLEAFDGLAGRFTSAVREREKYARELRIRGAVPSPPARCQVCESTETVLVPLCRDHLLSSKYAPTVTSSSVAAGPLTPRAEFELAIGTGKALRDLSQACLRGIRNHLPFTSPVNGDPSPDADSPTTANCLGRGR